MLFNRVEVDHAASESVSGSMRSGQSALVSSQKRHSGRLGTLRAGMGELIFLMNSVRRETNASFTLSAGICFSRPSAYTTTPSNFLPDQRINCDLGKRCYTSTTGKFYCRDRQISLSRITWSPLGTAQGASIFQDRPTPVRRAPSALRR